MPYYKSLLASNRKSQAVNNFKQTIRLLRKGQWPDREEAGIFSRSIQSSRRWFKKVRLSVRNGFHPIASLVWKSWVKSQTNVTHEHTLVSATDDGTAEKHDGLV